MLVSGQSNDRVVFKLAGLPRQVVVRMVLTGYQPVTQIVRLCMMVLAPGFFVWSTVQALYIVALGLRDALDPRLK